MKKLLGPAIVAATLIAASAAQPMIDQARAAALGKPALVVAQMSTSGTDASSKGEMSGTTAAGSGTANLGIEVDPSGDAKIYQGNYGPVDQSKPLDFSTQPSTVPHNYVGGKLYNVQVLKGYSYAQVIGQMGLYASALGVSCTYCHNAQNFAYDTATKKIARTMQIMSAGVTAGWIDPVKKDYPNYAVNGAVGCVTCHRGNPHMAVKWNIVPVQYLDYKSKTTKMAGYTLNSMYSAAKSLGTNCLFCHNSADFITLQYYPTNKIAHRMWAMVDEINHKYLPANVKAVTCYTCHQGNNWPQDLVTAGKDQTSVKAYALHPEVHENPGAHLASGAAQ